jgi:hypothetical protein
MPLSTSAGCVYLVTNDNHKLSCLTQLEIADGSIPGVGSQRLRFQQWPPSGTVDQASISYLCDSRYPDLCEIRDLNVEKYVSMSGSLGESTVQYETSPADKLSIDHPYSIPVYASRRPTTAHSLAVMHASCMHEVWRR